MGSETVTARFTHLRSTGRKGTEVPAVQSEDIEPAVVVPRLPAASMDPQFDCPESPLVVDPPQA